MRPKTTILLVILLLSFTMACQKESTTQDEIINNTTEDPTTTTTTTTGSYVIVDTGVIDFYNENSVIGSPNEGQAFYGQDAHYQTNTPSYTNNGDGTITDNRTGLMWQKIDNAMVWIGKKH